MKKLKVADAVWVATAHLHQENPAAADFPNRAIIERTQAEGLADGAPNTIQTHVFRHLVANLEPRDARYRMLHETTQGRRRLQRGSDSYDPGRQGPRDMPGTKVTPFPDDLPVELRPLLDWYANEYDQAANAANAAATDQLLAVRGRGRALWDSEPADAYVDRLRAAWT